MLTVVKQTTNEINKLNAHGNAVVTILNSVLVTSHRRRDFHRFFSPSDEGFQEKSVLPSSNILPFHHK